MSGIFRAALRGLGHKPASIGGGAFLDTFTRSDGSVGNGWSVINKTGWDGSAADHFQIVSNKLVTPFSSGLRGISRGNSNLNTEQILAYDSYGGAGGGGIGLLARLQPNGSCYLTYAAATAGYTYIGKIVGGGFTQLANAGAGEALTAGDIYRFVVTENVGDPLLADLFLYRTRGGVESLICTVAGDNAFPGAGENGIENDYAAVAMDNYQLTIL